MGPAEKELHRYMEQHNREIGYSDHPGTQLHYPDLKERVVAALDEVRENTGRDERQVIIQKVEAWRHVLKGDVDGLIHAIREPGDT